MSSLSTHISNRKDVVTRQPLLYRKTHVRHTRNFVRLEVLRTHVDVRKCERINLAQVAEIKAIGTVHAIPGRINCRRIGVGHLTAGVVVIVSLNTSVEKTSASTNHPIAFATNVPG